MRSTSPIEQSKPSNVSENVLLDCVWERDNWIELPTSAVEFKEKLGEGAFGEVFKGVVTISGKFRSCAIKKLKGNLW